MAGAGWLRPPASRSSRGSGGGGTRRARAGFGRPPAAAGGWIWHATWRAGFGRPPGAGAGSIWHATWRAGFGRPPEAVAGWIWHATWRAGFGRPPAAAAGSGMRRQQRRVAGWLRPSAGRGGSGSTGSSGWWAWAWPAAAATEGWVGTARPTHLPAACHHPSPCARAAVAEEQAVARGGGGTCMVGWGVAVFVRTYTRGHGRYVGWPIVIQSTRARTGCNGGVHRNGVAGVGTQGLTLPWGCKGWGLALAARPPFVFALNASMGTNCLVARCVRAQPLDPWVQIVWLPVNAVGSQGALGLASAPLGAPWGCRGWAPPPPPAPPSCSRSRWVQTVGLPVVFALNTSMGTDCWVARCVRAQHLHGYRLFGCPSSQFA